jgi:hypothetical protein
MQLTSDLLLNVLLNKTACDITNGALVCNNWKTDYGQICILFCENSYTVSRGVDADDFYICGASGLWTPKNTMPDCSGKLQIFNIQLNLQRNIS